MADQKLNLIVSAKDRGAVGVLNRIKSSIGGITTASLALVGGITGAVIATKKLISAASEAEETTNKFNVTFSKVLGTAEKASKELAKGFGLSSTAAKQLLADTGDLLSGFGFTQEAALDLSTQVQKLGTDLASFTNFSGGAQGASAALTKALLGERESVKSLGIAILEADVKAKVLEMTQRGVTFETERQAKAYATLEIALEQSKNAVGDFERSQGSFANQSRVLSAKLNDLAVALGEILLPTITVVVSGLAKLFKGLTDLINLPKKLEKEFNDFQASLNKAAKQAMGLTTQWKSSVFQIGAASKDLRKVTKKEFEAIIKNVQWASEEQKNAFVKAWKTAHAKVKEEQNKANAERLLAAFNAKEDLTEVELGIVEDLIDQRLRLTEKRGEALDEEIEQEKELRSEIDEWNKEREQEYQDTLTGMRERTAEKDEQIRLAREQAILDEMELTRTAAEFTAAVYGTMATSIGKVYSTMLKQMFTEQKLSAKALKDIWKGLVNSILDMIGKLIAKMVVMAGLMALFPGGGAAMAAASGFKGMFGRTLAGMFDIRGFQTPHGVNRVVPGPPNMPMPAVVHGGETIGRGGGGLTLVVQGDFLSTEETNAKIYEMQYEYRKRNDLN